MLVTSDKVREYIQLYTIIYVVYITSIQVYWCIKTKDMCESLVIDLLHIQFK